jgi:FMN reductase
MSGDRVVVLGSVTPPGRLRRALEEVVARSGGDAELLDLAEHELPFAGRGGPDADAAGILDRIAAAEAIILATPVYRGSMTGALKNLLDLLPVAALEGKAVGLVAMGASNHHFLGAERHLRDVLAFFGAVPGPVAVYLTAADFSDGVPGAGAEEALDRLLVSVAGLARALAASPAGPRPLAAAFA